MSRPTFQFGEFTLDTATSTLSRDGVRVPLEPQPTRLLEHLVLRAGEVVERTELAGTLWGDSGTHVSVDNGLNYCIRKIRTALGDDPSIPGGTPTRASASGRPGGPMARRRWVMAAGTAVGIAMLAGAAVLGPDLWFHLRPMSWSDEPSRLAERLELAHGHHVADLGAGSGALVVELARIVGPGGVAYASEMSVEKRASVASRAASHGIGWITVIEGQAHATGLPDACCEAVVMRMVAHHIADFPTFAVDLARVVRPGGRLGIIDFTPGAVPHLADDHGSEADVLLTALSNAGFRLESRDDHWGGRTYLLVFSRP